MDLGSVIARKLFTVKADLGVGKPITPEIQGNLDLNNRPVVKNPDGSISTVRSISVDGDRGRSILLPTVIGNRIVSNPDAIQHFQQTGENLGTFKNELLANAYAQFLHSQQAREYGK